MDRVGAIILARMDSRRLPGKALARIGNRSLLWHVACRLPRPLFDAPPVLATTNRAIDDPLAAEAAALGLTVFRGAAEDVAGRLLAAADAQRLDGILRVNGDSPFLDAGLIHRAMRIFRQGRAACVTNLRPRRHPYGVSVELFRPAALRVCLARSLNPTDREHVTTCLYAHLDATDLHTLDGADQNLGRDDWRVRLTVDEPADLDALRCFALSCSVPWDRVTYRQAVASGLFRLIPDDWPVSGLPGAAPSPALPQTLRTPAQPDSKVQ